MHHIPIDSVDRWENSEHEMDREPSLQRFIEKRKLSQLESRKMSRSDSQSSNGQHMEEYRGALDPKLSLNVKEPVDGRKKKGVRLKRSVKGKRGDEEVRGSRSVSHEKSQLGE